MGSNNGWSLERRERQREAIQRWKPWEKSTGPKTTEGKAKSACNSWKHGVYDAQSRELMGEIRGYLRDQREALNRVSSS